MQLGQTAGEGGAFARKLCSADRSSNGLGYNARHIFASIATLDRHIRTR